MTARPTPTSDHRYGPQSGGQPVKGGRPSEWRTASQRGVAYILVGPDKVEADQDGGVDVVVPGGWRPGQVAMQSWVSGFESGIPERRQGSLTMLYCTILGVKRKPYPDGKHWLLGYVVHHNQLVWLIHFSQMGMWDLNHSQIYNTYSTYCISSYCICLTIISELQDGATSIIYTTVSINNKFNITRT